MKPSQTLTFTRPLWGHQAEALDRFATATEAALLHEMGTGKTTTALGLLRAKCNAQKTVFPTLIVSPVATLYNWENEIKVNAPKLLPYTQVLDGKIKERIELLKADGKQIFITNPDALDTVTVGRSLRPGPFTEACMNRFRNGVFLLDEAQKFKNPKSKRVQAAIWIADLAWHRLLLTGTPILQGYLDIWAQWRILDRGATFGTSFFAFRERYFRDENVAWKGKPKYFPSYVPREGIEAELTALIDQKASRVKKSDCLTLPPLVRKTLHVELGKEQAKVYREMEMELIAEVEAGVCAATNALSRVLRMLQILSGYVQVTDAESWDGRYKLKENPRMELLKELIEELTPNHKVIVWCVFEENYIAIKKLCDDLGIGTAELTGRTKNRQAEIDRFRNDPDCRLMISNPQAGGVGVNLIEASYALYYSRNHSLGDRLQSEARNYRGGSEIHESITLIDIVAKGTLDEDVLLALSRKQNFADAILERLRELRNRTC